MSENEFGFATVGMSKLDGKFYHEPLPSSRDDSFYQEFRFKNVVDAEVAYRRFHH